MDEIATYLVGSICERIERSESGIWSFRFSERARLTVECSWRILADGRIAFGDGDHAHQFGLPAPLDGAAEARRLFGNRPVTAVSTRKDTGDLAIAFPGETVLEVINLSSGYEGWQLAADDGFLVVARGGGELVVWKAGRSQ
jgi:hypothetical protein